MPNGSKYNKNKYTLYMLYTHLKIVINCSLTQNATYDVLTLVLMIAIFKSGVGECQK